MSQASAKLVVLMSVLVVSSSAPAATYYIDFAGGSDLADGVSAKTAWKHCPGDPAAEGAPRSAKLAPGDRVVFKGGVDYRGTIVAPFSGAEGRPIVYDGNSGGAFGAGLAVIQGAEPVAGWKKAASAEEVGGNPNWQKLYVTQLEPGRSFFSFSLYESNAYLNCAQDPPPSMPFYHDRMDTWLKSPTADTASITDANCFTQKDAHYFDGAMVGLLTKDNWILYPRVREYLPAEHKITFENQPRLGEVTPARPRRYSLFNSLKFLGRPGEWVVEEPAEKGGRPRLILWPNNPGPAGPENVTISARKYGFDIQGASYVTIQGFRILQQGGDEAAGVAKRGQTVVRGIVVRDNEISRVRTYPSRSAAISMSFLDASVVERNDIYENAYCAGLMLYQFNDSVARGNLLHKNGSTAIDYYNCHRSRIERNVIRDNLGMHANGITMYVGCTDILVQGNEVHNANGVTTNEGNDIRVRYNLFDGSGKHMNMGLWASPPLNGLVVENNLIINSERGVDWSAAI
jgi:hypothetical protein